MGLPLAVAALAAAASLPGATGHALYGDEVASARIRVAAWRPRRSPCTG